MISGWLGLLGLVIPIPGLSVGTVVGFDISGLVAGIDPGLAVDADPGLVGLVGFGDGRGLGGLIGSSVDGIFGTSSSMPKLLQIKIHVK